MELSGIIIIALIVVACVVYFVYARTKKPISDMYITTGNELLKKGEYDNAIVQYEKAIKAGKYKKASKLVALNNICLCHLQKGDLEKAEEFASRCIDMSSTDTTSRLMYGKIRYLKEDYQGALDFYKNYVENIAPESDIAYSMLAMCYAKLCNEKKANEMTNKAIANKFNGANALRAEVKKVLKEAKEKKLTQEREERAKKKGESNKPLSENKPDAEDEVALAEVEAENKTEEAAEQEVGENISAADVEESADEAEEDKQ